MAVAEPDIDSCDLDSSQVANGEFVVAGRYGMVLFELVDTAFDSMTLLVDLGIERIRPTTTGSPPSSVGELTGRHGDGRFDSSPPQVGAGAIGLVGQHPIWSRAGLPGHELGNPDSIQDSRELRAVTPLTRSDHQRQRFTALLARQVQFRGPPAARAPQTMIGRLDNDPAGRFDLQIPLLRAPAACWCARAIVESTLISQTMSPAASAQICNADKIASQPPLRCQDRNNPYTDCHGPYCSGTSRHGAPTLVRQRIPLMSCRFIHFGGRPAFLPTGSSGSIAAHCSSARSARLDAATLVTRSPIFGSSW